MQTCSDICLVHRAIGGRNLRHQRLGRSFLRLGSIGRRRWHSSWDRRTVLTLWRNKLRASEAPERIFDAVREVVAATGVLAGKTRRALDSTVLDDAVARQDTVTMLQAQIRRARQLIGALAEVWVREHNLEPGRPLCAWDDPADVDRLVSELVDDANELVWAADDLELNDAQADAVALLALVAGQDVEPADEPGRWRIAQRTAPDRIVSTVDPESRHVHKTRQSYRDGYNPSDTASAR